MRNQCQDQCRKHDVRPHQMVFTVPSTITTSPPVCCDNMAHEGEPQLLPSPLALTPCPLLLPSPPTMLPPWPSLALWCIPMPPPSPMHCPPDDNQMPMELSANFIRIHLPPLPLVSHPPDTCQLKINASTPEVNMNEIPCIHLPTNIIFPATPRMNNSHSMMAPPLPQVPLTHHPPPWPLPLDDGNQPLLPHLSSRCPYIPLSIKVKPAQIHHSLSAPPSPWWVELTHHPPPD